MATVAMTGKQRYIASSRGERPDKLAFWAGNYNNFITRYYGITVPEYLDNPVHTAELMVKFVNEFEFDQLLAGVGYILYGCGPELGVKWEWAGDNFPAAVEGPFKTEADVDKFQIPKAPSGYFAKYLQNIGKAYEAIGDRVLVTASLLGPYSAACFLRGVENVMLDAKLNLPFYQKYMSKCVELSKYFGRELFKVFPTPLFNEVFLVPEMVSPKFYWDYIVPYDTPVCQEFKLSNAFAGMMGKPGDVASQKMGRFMYDYLYGTKESLQVIEAMSKTKIPGFGGFVTVSGRMLVAWSKDEILDFVKKGVDILMKAGTIPGISAFSVQPPSVESAHDVADKLHALQQFRDNYKL